MTQTTQDAALPIGARVGSCKIESLIAQSEFGFVYVATDALLSRKVAIKEYFPAALCERGEGGLQVRPRSPTDAAAFAEGRQAFIEEARLLARLEHPALVRVHSVFEAQQTVYRVMPLYEGVTLAQARQTRSTPPNDAWLRRLMTQLLEPLEVMHDAGVVHGHLHPEQVILTEDERPVLLGFGTVRRALHAPQNHGFAPIELSAIGSHLPRGAWTDLYSLAALAWFAATGRAPMPSIERSAGMAFDLAGPLTRALGRPSGREHNRAALVAAIEHALAPQPPARPQTVAAFRDELGTDPAAEAAAAAPPLPAEPDPAVRAAIAAAVNEIPDNEPGLPPPPAPSWGAVRGEDETERAGVARPSWSAVRSDEEAELAGVRRASRRSSQAPRVSASAVTATLVLALVVGAAAAAAWRWDDIMASEWAGVARTMLGIDQRKTASADDAGKPVEIAPVRNLPPVTLPTLPPPTAAAEAAPAPAASAAIAQAPTAPATPPPATPAGTVDGLPATAAGSTTSGSAITPAPSGTTPAPTTATPPPVATAVPNTVAPPVATAPPTPPSTTPPTVSPATATPPAPTQTAPTTVAAAPTPPAPPPEPPRAEPPVDRTPERASERPAERSADAAPKSNGGSKARSGSSTPAKTAAAKPMSPREVCGTRSNFSLHYCMQTQCRKPQYTQHPQCRTLRQTGEVAG